MARSNGTATADGTAPASPPKDTATVAFQLPKSFKEQLDNTAKDANKSVSDYVRNILAERFSWTLPTLVRGRRGQYAGMTKEQKTAAQKAKFQEKQAKVKALLALYESGKISPEMLASVQQPANAEAAPAPEPEPATA